MQDLPELFGLKPVENVLRHLFATHLLAMELICVSPRSCSDMLTSHADISTTEVYTHVDRVGSNQSIGDFIPVVEKPIEEKPWT